ncbi:MAG: MFS transporter [Pseudomonadota bacterium]
MTSPTSQAQRGRAWAIFAVASLGFVLSQFYRVSNTVISEDLIRDLGLTVEDLGTLSAAFFYAFAASQIPLGLALDRVGPRRAIIPLSLAGLVGAGAFALAHDNGVALVGRVLLGIGMSCNLMGALALLAAWFPPQVFATLSGLLVGVGYLGGLLAATPLAWLASGWGWRWAFAAIAILHAAQTLMVVLVVRDRPAGGAFTELKRAKPWSGLGQVLYRPAFWAICLGTFFRYGCFAALMGLWAGPFLMTALGWSKLETGNALTTLTVAHIIGLPLTGNLSDRWLGSRKWVIAPALFASALLTWSLAGLQDGAPWWAVHGLFALIGFASAPGQIMYAHVKELVPGPVQGTAMTGINLFTMLGPAVVMQAAGALVAARPHELGHPAAFAPAWLFMAGGLVLAGLAYLALPDSRPASRVTVRVGAIDAKP